MQLSDVLTLKGNAVVSLPPDATAAEAVAMMVDRDLGSVVVLDRGRLAGVLTFREVLKAVHERGGAFASTPVKEIMDTRLIVGQPDDSIDRVREVMTEHACAVSAGHGRRRACWELFPSTTLPRLH